MKTIIIVSLFVLSGCSAFSSKPLVVQVSHDKAGRSYVISGDASDVAGAIDKVQDR